MSKGWKLNQLALQGHLKEEALDNFLRWSTIEKTMFVGDVDFVHREYSDIVRDGCITTGVLEESKVGNPKLLWGWTSGNLIHQYYHLKQWQDRSRAAVSQLSEVCEIGAGYGAMALICRRLGFTGWYRIFDLPELIKLQRHYLYLTGASTKTLWTSEDYGASKKSCDLLIACHSLSEMPITKREQILSQTKASAYLFASAYEFEGVDNQTWFQQFAGSEPGYDWVFYPHPYQENAFYLVGVKLS